ncbi:DUF4920 domain-containing protein [Halocola ammonii]
MKKLLYLLFGAAVLVACQNNDNATADKENKEEETSMETPMAHYGEEFEIDGAISVADLEKEMEGKDSMMTVVKAPIYETCTKMGCWMRVDMGEEEQMMVYMNDHSFFVPKSGVDGKMAYMTGKAFRDTVTVDMLKHYAEDAGKPQEEIDAITEPEYALAFNAMGVVIEDHEDMPEEEAKEEEMHEGHDHEGHDHEGEEHMHEEEKEVEKKM